MKARWKIIMVSMLLLAAVWPVQYWLSPRFVLDNSDSFVLYSLAPFNMPEFDWHRGSFHHSYIRTKIPITDPKLRARIVEALYTNASHSGFKSFSYLPEYGIRATRGGRTVDVTVAFRGRGIVFFENDITRDYRSISGLDDNMFRAISDEGTLPKPLPVP